MKRVLCIIIGLNIVASGKTFADDSLTGLHIGFGLNVFADEYKSDVDVLAIVNSGEPTPARWEFTGPAQDKDDYTGYQFGHLTPNLFNAIISHNNENEQKPIKDLYKEKHYPDNSDYTNVNNDFNDVIKYPNLKEATVTYIPRGIDQPKTSYFQSTNQFKRSSIMCGGELKMSYYHNLYGIFNVGVDVSGNIQSKRKISTEIDKVATPFNKNQYSTVGYLIPKNGNVLLDSITYDNSQIDGYFLDSDSLGKSISTSDYTFTEKLSDSVSSNISIPELNQGYTPLETLPSDTSQYLQVSNEKGGDVSFEKNKFNSRAAVVLGAQYKGWFAGVRGGVSYNQGKIHVKDSTGTSSEEISFASPFVGVHLMKSVNMKGLENGHIYVTADVNVENKQKLNMRWIKNVKHNSVNVSLGMTWQIN